MPGASMALQISGAPSGVSMGVQITDDDGDVVLARSGSVVLELPPGSGTYLATFPAPAVDGNYEGLWDTGAISPFVVAPAADPHGSRDSRAFQMTKTGSRAYGYAERSVMAWLVDAAYLIRETFTGESDDGTPTMNEHDWGPYASRLSQPDRNEEREDDHFQTVASYTLLVACDLQPTESDYFDVLCQDPTRDAPPVGVRKRYRVTSGVEPRAPTNREPLLWKVPLAITTEY
jgi:hypothetical protein